MSDDMVIRSLVEQLERTEREIDIGDKRLSDHEQAWRDERASHLAHASGLAKAIEILKAAQ